MALIGDLVQEYTTTTGTGTVTLTAVAGFARFSDVFSLSDVVYYSIEDGSNREVGSGVVSAANTLTRATIYAKYEGGVYTANPGTGISLSGVNAKVFCGMQLAVFTEYGAAQGTGDNHVFVENDTNVTANYTITSGNNAMSAGPITIDAGVVVTVPAGSVWSIV